MKLQQLTEAEGGKAYMIFATDDNGRYRGAPLGVVSVSEMDDWMEEKQSAVDAFVSQNPDQKGNRGWLTAIPANADEVAEKVSRLKKELTAWENVARSV